MSILTSSAGKEKANRSWGNVARFWAICRQFLPLGNRGVSGIVVTPSTLPQNPQLRIVIDMEPLDLVKISMEPAMFLVQYGHNGKSTAIQGTSARYLLRRREV